MRRLTLLVVIVSLIALPGLVRAQDIGLRPLTTPIDPFGKHGASGEWTDLEVDGKETDMYEKIPSRTDVPEKRPEVNRSKEGPSEFESFISGKDKESQEREEVRQYGYGLFDLPPSTFAPVENVPVGPDYVIGPGDEIRVTVWGKVEGRWGVVVDSDGNISLPRVGVLGVAGLTFKELKDTINKEFSKYYKDYDMNVSLGALRSIRVYVVGNARNPGAYTVSALSTLVNALFEAGGPSKTGSMRDIQLKRAGGVIVHFDMYDFLLKGDKSSDARLMPEDVIFIPPIGRVAAVTGSVKNPAIFELKDERTISDLIGMAGGLNAVAFAGRVQVERIVDSRRQVVFESNLDEIRDLEVELASGDIVRVFQVIRDKNYVRVSGAVQREGAYGVREGMTVKDLLELAGGVKQYAYTKDTELTRVHITDRGPVTEKITINLDRALAGGTEDNIGLVENDYLFVRSVPEWRLYELVSISGNLKFPGTYTISKGEKLSSLIRRAGGFTDDAFLRGSVFIRQSVKELQQKQLNEMILRLERELLGLSAADIGTSLSADEAKVRQLEADQKRKFIESLKKVKASGRMVIRLSSLEGLAGTRDDIELEPGDSLFVPSNPNSIQVVGSVYNQTAFIYDMEKSFSDYIGLTGGYTENADSRRAYILKVDGTAVKPEKGFSWNRGSNRWDYSNAGWLEPGDTIVVPERIEKVAWLREFKDLTQILYQIAVTAGVLIVVF